MFQPAPAPEGRGTHRESWRGGSFISGHFQEHEVSFPWRRRSAFCVGRARVFPRGHSQQTLSAPRSASTRQVLGQGKTLAQRCPADTGAERARVSRGAAGQPDAAPCAFNDASPPPRRRPGPGQGRPSPYRASSGPWTHGPGRAVASRLA